MSTPPNQNVFESLTQGQLDDIILKHNMFMRGKPGGGRALLKFKDLTGLNFRSGDLTGADFTACTLRGANMSGGNFTNGIFYGADLQLANLENAIFRRADFRGAYIAGANLSHADMAAADMREGKILERGQDGKVVERDAPEGLAPKTVFIGARLTQTNLSGIRASTADFSDADLSGVIIRGADLRSANFKGANLSQSDLSGSDLRHCNLQNTIMTGIIMEQAETTGMDDQGAVKTSDTMGEKFDTEEKNLENLITEHVLWITSMGGQGRQLDLSGFDLRNLHDLKGQTLTALIARGATFVNLDLKGIQLQSAVLDGSDFRDCNLSRADMRGSSMVEVNFARTDLTSANFGPLHFGKPGAPDHKIKPTVLRKTNFRYAQLIGTNFVDCDLTGVDFSYANLTNANLQRAVLTDANLSNTKMTGTILDPKGESKA